MRPNILLNNIEVAARKGNVEVKRYTLSDMISESYNLCYDSEEGSNLKKLAEAHLEDVKKNPTDIDRLSRQMCNLKYLASMVESRKMRDVDLIKKAPTVRPLKKSRVLESRVTPKKSPRRRMKESKTEWQEANGAMTPTEMRRYWARYKDSDPILADYDSYEDWYKDSEESGFVVHDEDMEESKRSPRRKLKDCNESTDEELELSEEELDELANHLAEMRKKKGMKESRSPRRRMKGSMNEAKSSYVVQYGVDILTDDAQYDVDYRIESALHKVGIKVLGVQPTDTSWSVEDYENYTGVKVKNVLGESKKFPRRKMKESKNLKKVRLSRSSVKESKVPKKKALKSWSSIKEGMKNFNKASSSKAFYKTFKKMYESLKEGKALTRQESINLYKAANSAMTHFSVELEHNPKFLNVFNECTSLLSKDVDSLLESLKKGKAPSKYTMKSLAKFAEALLYESEDGYPKREYEYLKKNYEKCKSEYETRGEEDNNDVLSREEKMRIAKAQMDDASRRMKESAEEDEGLKYVDNVNGYKVYRKIENGKGVWFAKRQNDHDNKMFPITYEQARGYEEIEGSENIRKLRKDLGKKLLPESAEEEVDLDDIETSIEDEEADSIDNEEDFVGDDEGDIKSEEEEKFCQEYADAREELHNDMEEKYEDTEDPGVQEKIAQDAEEVAILKGEDPEEEESPADGEESEEDEESDEEDDSDITDDELAELKKHLSEMRKAKKSCK